MLFIYDICVHEEGAYREEYGVEFSNPVHIGDFIKIEVEDTEYEVFQVVHSDNCGKSVLHVYRLAHIN